MTQSWRKGLGLCILATVIFFASSALALDRAGVGDKVENIKLKTLDGKSMDLMSATSQVRVFYFFRPDQEHAQKGLEALRDCAKGLVDKPVSWTAVVSDAYPAKEVRALVKKAKLTVPILIDKGDVLYGRLGFRLHPMVSVVDKDFKLIAVQPYAQVNFAHIICAHVHYALGLISDDERQTILHPQRQEKLDPNKTQVARELKLVGMLIKVKKYDKAMALVDKVQAEHPDNASLWVAKAEILAAQNKCPEAKKALKQAKAKNPKANWNQASQTACAK